jgi:hypothetical protein
MRTCLLALLIALAPTMSLADRKAGDACAQGLPAVSRTIYANTIASHPAPGDARALVVSQAEKLIADGKLTAVEARAAAEAAGKCLELILK